MRSGIRGLERKSCYPMARVTGPQLENGYDQIQTAWHGRYSFNVDRSSAASICDRGPRGRSSTLERRLHDRPGPQPVWRAHVGLWPQRAARWTEVALRHE